MRSASLYLRSELVSLVLAAAFGCGNTRQEQPSFPNAESSFGHRERAPSEAQPEGSAERDAIPVDVPTPDDPASPDADGATPLSEEHAAALAAELANDPI